MRILGSVILAVVLLASTGVAADPPARMVRDLDMSVFTCIPSPTHLFIESEAGLAAVFVRLAPHCSAKVFEQRKAALLRDLTRARFSWSDEVLVIAMDWYGTGMAKPRLVFSGPADGLLTATIHWDLPPPPHTPDTASCRFAFAVKRSAATEIKVVGQKSGTARFKVSPQGGGEPGDARPPSL